MALPAPLHRHTYAEYVAIEALSPVKHEFLQGDIYALAGGTPEPVTNPLLLVEITSDSTEKYDRGEKLALYQQLDSLREVLIVSHRERRLTVHRRVGGAWTIVGPCETDTMALESVGGSLDVASVYASME